MSWYCHEACDSISTAAMGEEALLAVPGVLGVVDVLGVRGGVIGRGLLRSSQTLLSSTPS